MAQQLREQGEDVTLLALFDVSAMPGQLGTLPEDDAALLADVFADAGFSISDKKLRKMPQDDMFAFALDQANNRDWLPAYTDLADFRRYFEIYKWNREALKSYVTPAYPGEIVLFRCSEPSVTDAGDLQPDWSTLAGKKVQVLNVPGTHHTILNRPNVQLVADGLKAILGLEHTASSSDSRLPASQTGAAN